MNIDPSEISAVYFDAVGTLLFPSEPVHKTYHEFGQRYGSRLQPADVHSRLRSAFQRQEQADAQAGWTTSEPREFDRWRTIVAEVFSDADHETCFRELWDWYSLPSSWNVADGTSDLLAKLSRDFVVGLASNFDSRLLNLVSYFPELTPIGDRCVISSVVGYRKPSAFFFAAVADAANAPPNRVLYVGDDRRNDYEGALAAGMRAVLVEPSSGANTLQRLLRAL